MSRDEDALHWEGDEELDHPTADATEQPPAATASVAVDEPAARSRGALRWLMLALALAATAGWVVIIVANPVEQPSLLGLAMYQLGELLAAIAPLLWWFLVDRLATARRAPLWLAGLVVTAPWPLVAGVLA
ncbi:hypothetical protein [Agrococcus jenensis]|uniref:Uncharacterized protein n=1 Tax=Agrococcus jenensis TaxID=46353 RepID=A0A3N2AP75_9MICO|nr:hypothetical protein [Agrococcus jenensis]ROR64796.1 hypothetical protein EDD26_0145 [Agrococcus jenensis]